MSDFLQGKFLVACSQLRDESFFKTAVLIVEHGTDGAMGLVINRPSPCTVADALTGHLELPGNEELVFVGGPVEPAALFVVHNSACMDPQEAPVVPDVYMGSSAEIFEDILKAVEKCPDELKCRVFSGCAGWGPGQLEDEVERGDWLICDAEAHYVFHEDPYAIWDLLVTKSYASKRLLPHECEHPEWN